MNKTKSKSKSKSKPKKLTSIHTLEIFKKALSSSAFSQNTDTKMKKDLISLIDISIDTIEKHPDPVLFDKNIYENLRICIETIPIIFHDFLSADNSSTKLPVTDLGFKTFLRENVSQKDNTYSTLSVLNQLEEKMIAEKKRFNLSKKKTTIRKKSPFHFRGGFGFGNNVLGSISRFIRRNINNDARVHLQEAEFEDMARVISDSLSEAATPMRGLTRNNNAGPGAYPVSGTGIPPPIMALRTSLLYSDTDTYTETLPQNRLTATIGDLEALITDFEIVEDPHTNTYPALITHLSNQELKQIISNIIDRWCHWNKVLEISLLLFVSVIGITAFLGGIIFPGTGFATIPLFYFIFTGSVSATFFLKSGFNTFRFTKNKEKCKVDTLNDILGQNNISIENWNNGNVDIESLINDPVWINHSPWLWKQIQRHYPIISSENTIHTAEPIPDIPQPIIRPPFGVVAASLRPPFGVVAASLRPPFGVVAASLRTRLPRRTRLSRITRRINDWTHRPRVIPTIEEEEEY